MKDKYLKYKKKYLDLKALYGGMKRKRRIEEKRKSKIGFR